MMWAHSYTFSWILWVSWYMNCMINLIVIYKVRKVSRLSLQVVFDAEQVNILKCCIFLMFTISIICRMSREF